MKVVVLHNTEHGWDCIEGVFSSEVKAVEYLNTHYNKNDPDKNKEEWEEICWIFTNKTVME